MIHYHRVFVFFSDQGSAMNAMQNRDTLQKQKDQIVSEASMAVIFYHFDQNIL